MKERCIMIFPKFKNMDIIHQIRRKYDPLANHVSPHITLVFPFKSEIRSNELKNYLESVLSTVNPFQITLKGITPVKSFGNHLFLNIKNGADEIAEIHRRLYTGILESYLPPWLKEGNYLPHMTVGKIEKEEEYKKAIIETKDIINVFTCNVNKISVEIIAENKDSIIEMEIELK